MLKKLEFVEPELEFINPNIVFMFLSLKIGVIVSFIEIELFYERSILEYLRLMLLILLPLINIDYLAASLLLIPDYLFILFHAGFPAIKDCEDADLHIKCDIHHDQAAGKDRVTMQVMYKNRKICNIENCSQNPNLYLPMIREIIENKNISAHKIKFIKKRLNFEWIKQQKIAEQIKN
jgi:hypothetical protein